MYCSFCSAAPLSRPVMVGMSENISPTNTIMAQINLRTVGFLQRNIDLKKMDLELIQNYSFD